MRCFTVCVPVWLIAGFDDGALTAIEYAGKPAWIASDVGRALGMAIHRDGHFACRWDRFNLAAGSYVCSLYCSINDEVADWVEAAVGVTAQPEA